MRCRQPQDETYSRAYGDSVGILPSGSDSPSAVAAASSTSNAKLFGLIFDHYNQLQQQICLENMEMEKAQKFWNPLESMSRRMRAID